MLTPTTRLRFFIERALPVLVFLWLGWWTYILFVHVPYAGFDFDPSDGRITAVYNTSSNMLLKEDRLLQVGMITWETFKDDLRLPIFTDEQPGQIVQLRIQREKQKLALDWIYPGFTWAEFRERLISEWLLAYAFWFAGTLTLLFLRPKDERWWLLAAFNFLTAICLAGGSAVPRWRAWNGAVKVISLTWLCMPIYLHLHWVFPRPLGKIPTSFWRLFYLVACILAVTEYFRFLPVTMFWVGFLLAVIGSILLLVLHFLLQSDKRREIGLLIVAVSLSILPTIGVGIVRLFNILPVNAGLVFLALPIWPLAYFYAAAYRQLGDLERRANRLISLYIFLILLGTIALILVPLVHSQISEPGTAIAVNLIAILLAVLLTAIGFTPFQRLVERYLLGMPLPPTHLLESYATQITTSLELKHLLSLLQEQIFPSLMVRQAVLLQLDEDGRCTLLGKMGVDDDQLPSHDDLSELLEQKGRTRRTSEPLVACCPWVSVILPLQIEQKTIGLWLLGRRDPDDFYAQTEIITLQAIANQSAIALTNIAQAEQLRTLHQTSIDRQESERREIAHELHDVVLNQLAVLKTSAQHQEPSRFEDNYHITTQKVRQIIKGLRPPLLTYGLRPALQQLIYDLTERDEKYPLSEVEQDEESQLWEADLSEERLLWEVDLSEENFRYDSSVEQHLFRIVQQACENALRHGQAYNIFVTGSFTPTKIELIVADDGIGFERDAVFDLNHLLSHGHFGLVGMLERAEIIGATLKIESKPNDGTSVHVTWSAPKSSTS